MTAQQQVLDEVDASFAPLTVWRSPYRSCEPVGLEELAAFGAELYGTSNPFGACDPPEPIRLRREGSTVSVSVALPFAEKPDIDLARRGDDLMVTVGAHRRVVSLPLALRGAAVLGARFDSGILAVTFDTATQLAATAGLS